MAEESGFSRPTAADRGYYRTHGGASRHQLDGHATRHYLRVVWRETARPNRGNRGGNELGAYSGRARPDRRGNQGARTDGDETSVLIDESLCCRAARTQWL